MAGRESCPTTAPGPHHHANHPAPSDDDDDDDDNDDDDDDDDVHFYSIAHVSISNDAQCAKLFQSQHCIHDAQLCSAEPNTHALQTEMNRVQKSFLFGASEL